MSTVELFGGPADGRRWDVGDLGCGLLASLSVPIPAEWNPLLADPSGLTPFRVAEYRLAGRLPGDRVEYRYAGLRDIA